MSAIALTLAEMGHDVSGSDLRELPVLDRLRAAGVTVHVGHDPDHVKGVDAVTSSTAIPAENVELVAAAADGRHRAPPGRDAGRHLRAGQRAGRRRHARQDDHDLDAGHGAGRGRARPELRRRRRPPRGRAPVRTGPAALAGGRGRRERRDPPRAAPRRHDPDERRGRPPRPLRHLRRGRRRVRPLPGPVDGPRSSAPTTRSTADLAARHDAITYGIDADAPLPRPGHRAPRARCASWSTATAPSSARSSSR